MLRGINVSGHKTIRMAELVSLYESLSFENVRTYVQSGNVAFDSTEQDASELAVLIEAQIKQSFGFSVSVLVRNARDFQRVIDSNPFLHGRNEDPTKLHVTFLYTSPSKSALSNLTVPTNGADECFVGDKEVFLFCPNGYGRTKLSNTFFERKLNTLATTRNWKTVNALYRMALEG